MTGQCEYTGSEGPCVRCVRHADEGVRSSCILKSAAQRRQDGITPLEIRSLMDRKPGRGDWAQIQEYPDKLRQPLMIVERRIENRIVAGPPIVTITKEQRRLIDYWKLRVDSWSGGDVWAMAHGLSKAFQSANADDEELRYWSVDANPLLRQEMLIAFFVRTGDFNGLYRLCKSDDFEGYMPWESLKELGARRPDHHHPFQDCH